MAESWLKYTPASGTASGVVTCSTDFFYGRKARNGTINISTTVSSPTISKNIIVKQYGYGPYSYINNENVIAGSNTIISVNRTATSAVFNLDVNFKKLEITQIDQASYPLVLNFQNTNSWTGVISGSGTWTNGNDIVGDPGASQRYKTSLTVTFTLNTSSLRSGKLRLRCYYNTTEHDISGIIGTDAYEDFFLIVQQEGIAEYTVSVGQLTPLDGDGDNMTWKLSLVQSDLNPTTHVTGSFNINLNNGQYDNCTVDGFIDGENEFLQVLTLTGESYMRNSELVSGEISTKNFSATSETDGYVCTDIS